MNYLTIDSDDWCVMRLTELRAKGEKATLVLEKNEQCRVYRVYIVRADGAEEFPPSAVASGIFCDVFCGTGLPSCRTPPTWVCECERCAREPGHEEKFHTCETHRNQTTVVHSRIRGRQASWVPYKPS